MIKSFSGFLDLFYAVLLIIKVFLIYSIPPYPTLAPGSVLTLTFTLPLPYPLPKGKGKGRVKVRVGTEAGARVG